MTGTPGDHEDPKEQRNGKDGFCSDIQAGHIIILVLCFWINVQSASSISCLGVLLVEFMEYYRTPKAAVTWVAGAHMGVSVVVGPVVGILLKRFGYRPVGIGAALLSASGMVMAAFINNLTSLYFTFGLMAGAGPCSYYAIANSTVQHYFRRHRSLAAAVVLTAFSIGGFAWPPFCRWLISIYSWQGALLVIGALHIQLLVPFMILGVLDKTAVHLRTEELAGNDKISSAENKFTENLDGSGEQIIETNSSTQNGVLHETDNRVTTPIHKNTQKLSFCQCFTSWLTLTFIYSLAVCFGMILHAGVLVYTPVRSWQLGISKDQGALLVSIISAAGGFCRIPAGLLGDVKGVNRGLLLAASILICGVLAFLSQFISGFIPLAAFSAIYGSIIAVYLALQTVVLSDIAGMEHLQVAMGILLAGHGTSNLLLHPIAGALIDLTGSANTVFITVGVVGMVGGSLVTMVTALKIYSRRNQKERPPTLDAEEAVPLQETSNSSNHVKQPCTQTS